VRTIHRSLPPSRASRFLRALERHRQLCLVATRTLLLLQHIHSVMAGHYLQSGQPDSRFNFHESEQMLMDPRIHLPADHLSNSAFWYRPDTSRPVVERQEGIHLSHGGIPSIEAVKHRRTRSGCFTCRSRRVKVGNAMSLRSLHYPGADNALSATRPDQYAIVSCSTFCSSWGEKLIQLSQGAGRAAETASSQSPLVLLKEVAVPKQAGFSLLHVKS
jgi:hypothetical protein